MNCSCSVTKRMHKREKEEICIIWWSTEDEELDPLVSPDLASDLRCSDYGHNVSKLVSGLRTADGN